MTYQKQFEQENFVKRKLQAGQPVLGIWSIINSPTVLEIVGRGGFDFQILDMEHGVFDIPSLEAGIRVCESVGCSPLVRSPGLNAPFIQNVLDIGAHGIIVPQVKDFESALEAVRTTKYAPLGVRGFNPFTRAGGYRGGTEGPKPGLTDSFGLSSIIIETLRAYEQLDAILGIKDLDMIYLGAYDMSIALGCMGEMNNPKVIEFLESSIPRIRAAGKAAGIMVKNQSEIERYLKLGANFMVYTVDTFVISNAIRNVSEMFTKVARGN